MVKWFALTLTLQWDSDMALIDSGSGNGNGNDNDNGSNEWIGTVAGACFALLLYLQSINSPMIQLSSRQ
jgi:hypothetical protein